MKKISTSRLALAFAGSFLGAGYVSGQEIWQFFGTFGFWGVIGLVIAMSILGVLGFMLTRIVRHTGNDAIDVSVVGEKYPHLMHFTGVMELFMLFGTFFVMIAAASALFDAVIPLPHISYIGGALFTVFIAIGAIVGFPFLVKLYSVAVPLLVFVTCAVAVCIFFRNGCAFRFIAPKSPTPMLPNWISGCITFTAYNYFCSVGVLCGIGKYTSGEKSIRRAMTLGSIFLFAVAFAIILSVTGTTGAADAELPMLTAAGSISPLLMYVYAFLLLLGMTGASLSCLIPFMAYVSARRPFIARRRVFFTFFVSAVAYGLSTFGFADLVGNVFSLFGYFSVVIVITTVCHYISLFHEKNHQQEEQV